MFFTHTLAAPVPLLANTTYFIAMDDTATDNLRKGVGLTTDPAITYGGEVDGVIGTNPMMDQFFGARSIPFSLVRTLKPFPPSAPPSPNPPLWPCSAWAHSAWPAGGYCGGTPPGEPVCSPDFRGERGATLGDQGGV
jgi:hypothetical protein